MTAIQWKPGLDPITGMAAHPSMQAKETPEIRGKLARAKYDLEAARQLQPSAELTDYQENLGHLIAAYELALKWRAESDRS